MTPRQAYFARLAIKHGRPTPPAPRAKILEEAHGRFEDAPPPPIPAHMMRFVAEARGGWAEVPEIEKIRKPRVFTPKALDPALVARIEAELPPVDPKRRLILDLEVHEWKPTRIGVVIKQTGRKVRFSVN